MKRGAGKGARRSSPGDVPVDLPCVSGSGVKLVRRRRGVAKLLEWGVDLRFVPVPTGCSVASLFGAFIGLIERALRLGIRWTCFMGVRRGWESEAGKERDDDEGADAVVRKMPPSSSSMAIGCGFPRYRRGAGDRNGDGRKRSSMSFTSPLEL